MAKSSAASLHLDRALYPESVGTQIRAFLASVIPVRGSNFGSNETFLVGRELIEELALAHDCEYPNYWALPECAAVVKFLNSIEPGKGICYCGSKLHRGVRLLCGHQIILETLEEELRRLALKSRAPKRKRDAGVAHG